MEEIAREYGVPQYKSRVISEDHMLEIHEEVDSDTTTTALMEPKTLGMEYTL